MMMFCCNIVMQVVFLFAIATTMNGDPYKGDTISSMKYQRLGRGSTRLPPVLGPSWGRLMF